jgi:hypothetical protein
MAEDVTLLAGTIVEHETAPGVWAVAPSLTSIGETGEMSEPKEKTTLADRIKRYGSGLRDAPDKTLQGQYIPVQQSGDENYANYVLQQAFIQRCRNEEEFNMRIKWPDNTVAGFLFKSFGFKITDGTQEDWKMWEVAGKQNSRPVWTVTVTGPATVAATPIQLSITTVPSLNAAEIGTVTWKSSDTASATVSASGLVTKVGTGAVTITAEVRGVVGSLAVTVS